MSYQTGNPYITNIVPLFNVANSGSGATTTVNNTGITNLQSLLDYNNKGLKIDTISAFTLDNTIQVNNNLNINGQLLVNQYILGPDSKGNSLNTSYTYAISTPKTTLTMNSVIDNALVPNFNIYMNGSNVFSIDSNGNTNFLNPVTGPAFNVVSDVRYKNHINPLINSLSTICELKGVEYVIDNISTIGLLAQDADLVMPCIVNKTNPDKWSVNYIQLIPMLIESIKELRAKLELR